MEERPQVVGLGNWNLEETMSFPTYPKSILYDLKKEQATTVNILISKSQSSRAYNAPKVLPEGLEN